MSLRPLHPPDQSFSSLFTIVHSPCHFSCCRPLLKHVLQGQIIVFVLVGLQLPQRPRVSILDKNGWVVIPGDLDGPSGKAKIGIGTHGWVHSETSYHTHRPTFYHPDLHSSYRSELSGLLALLYLFHRLCGHNTISEGHISTTPSIFIFIPYPTPTSVTLKWYMTCWLSSVAESCRTALHHDRILREQSARVFAPFQLQSYSCANSSSRSPSSVITWSMTTTL
jgi:hypothetical protein